MGIGSMSDLSGPQRSPQHSSKVKQYDGLADVRQLGTRPLTRFGNALWMAWAVLAAPQCAPAVEQEQVRLGVLQPPGCEVGGGEAWALRAHGDSASVERTLAGARPAPVRDLPLGTEWLTLELSDAQLPAGGLVAVHGHAVDRDVLVLPLGRSCPLGDSAAAAAPGAALSALDDGGLLIAGGQPAGRPATDAAHWLPPGELLMREVEGGMLLRRAGASATRVGGHVLVAGGAVDDRGAAHDTFEIYVANAQRFDNALSGELAGGSRRDHAAIALDDGRVLLIGGRADLQSGAIAGLETIAAGVRSQPAGELQIGRVAPTALRLDSGALLVALGERAPGVLVPEVERVDPSAGRSAVVASFPAHPLAAVAALEGERVAQLGCDGDGSCELSLLLPQGDGFQTVAALSRDALAQAGISALTGFRLHALRDGRLLIAAAQRARSKPLGFVIDLSTASIAAADLTRTPDRLLALDDGVLAELDSSGLSLLRLDLLSELDDVPDPLAWDSPFHLALDHASRWERDDVSLRALEPARFDLPYLRFAAVRVAFTPEGPAALLLEPRAGAPLRVEIAAAAVRFGACSLPRRDGEAVQVERRADRLMLTSAQGTRACELDPALGRVGIALQAEAATRIRALHIERL